MSVNASWPEAKKSIAAIPAAKLHVLQLEPIKQKVGDRWPRLSLLVHTLFENALKRAQGPRDHFVQVDELSYLVTFHGRSLHETNLACAAIAQEVCARLFGEGAEAVSVRSVVGEVPEDQVRSILEPHAIAALLERTGSASVTTKNSEDAEAWQTKDALEAQLPGDAVIRAHRVMESINRKARFLPLWDLKKHTSSALIFCPAIPTRMQNGNLHGVSAGAIAPKEAGDFIVNLEMTLLRAAGEYAQRIQAAHKICAVGAGVSYETLSALHARVRYITALRAIETSPNCPLILKIEDIPQGVHVARLWEIMAMLAAPHVRLMVEFSDRIPQLDVPLGVAGIGAVLPQNCPVSNARTILKSISNRVLGQHAFEFVSGLDTPILAGLAEEYHLRFGMGAALDKAHQYTGLEAIPDLPLRSATSCEVEV
jgi:hypothetical protein